MTRLITTFAVAAAAAFAGSTPAPALADARGVAATNDRAACRVDAAAGTRASDAEKSRAMDSCRNARSAFAELLGDPVPPVRVVLWEQQGYRMGVDGHTAVVFWPVDRTRAVLPEDAAVLPHEIAHVLLAARFDGAAGEAGAAEDGYGTPLPDWFEEGVAIWAEPRGQRAGRVAQARALPPERLELRSILRSSHPAAADDMVLAARDGGAIPADRELWDFYSRSIALLSFVFEQGGAEAVGALADRLVADPADARALAGLPGLPAEHAEIRQAWDAWIAAPADAP